MRSIAELEARLEAIVTGQGTPASAEELLQSGEAVLEHWVIAKGEDPTTDEHEGFRLLALHRQGARDDVSFNACRETCRELVYHYNVMSDLNADAESSQSCLQMMALIANHLILFVGGKMQEAGLGDFCCSAKPLHDEINDLSEVTDA